MNLAAEQEEYVVESGEGVHKYCLCQMNRLQHINAQLVNLYQNTLPINGGPPAKSGEKKRGFMHIACVSSSLNSRLIGSWLSTKVRGAKNGSELSWHRTLLFFCPVFLSWAQRWDQHSTTINLTNSVKEMCWANGGQARFWPFWTPQYSKTAPFRVVL